MAVYKPKPLINPTTKNGGGGASSSSLVSLISSLSESQKSGAGSTALVPYSSAPKAPTVAAPSTQKNEVGVVGRTVATFGDIVANVLAGAAKSLEGIYDFGATAVGAVGGIFSDEFQEAVRKHVSYDFVGDKIEDPLERLTESSYLNELRIGKYSVGEAVELIAQGVGGMLPSIGFAALTGGGSVAAQTIAGTGSMMAGAAGNATEEAMNKGASYGSAALYGATRGAIEGATEFLGGVTLGGGTSLIGKKLAGTALGNATQKGVGKVVYNFASEGAEEVLSDLTDPLTKYLTGVDKNIGENYNDTIKGLPETFLIGGSVGTLMGGAQDFVRSRSKEQAARGGGAATRSDYFLRNVIEMNENEGTGADAERFAAAKMSSYQMMSYELQRMSPEHRAKYLDSIGVHKLAFDEKGQLVAKVAENVNAEAVSPTLRSLSGNLAHAPIGADVQIRESAATAKETVLKAVGKRANVVITDAIEGNNALYNLDEDVIYISNGEFDGSSFNTEDVARAIALHEVAHKAEGTEAYDAMADELRKIMSDENAPKEVKVLLGDLVKRTEGIIEDYADGNLSEFQNEYVIDTELVSNLIGDLLGNPYFVERMGARNDGAWKRFVLALRAAHDGKAAGISKEAQKYLSGLYKAYVKAVDDARQGVKVSSIVDEEEKEKGTEGVSEVAEIEANERKAKQSVNNHFIEDKYFKSQMSKWEDLKHGAYVNVGQIGKNHPLHLVGMPTGVLRYDVDKLKRNMADHGDYLTAELLKAIPGIVATPIAISEFSEENTVSVFGDVFVGKSPMMVGVTISKDRAGNSISKVRTLNARKDVGNLVTDDTVLYLGENKKKTRKWFQACGIQVPLGETKFGFIRSISHSDDFVNKKNSDERSSKQSHIQKAKTKAEYTGEKVYSKKEARETFQGIIDSILEDHELMLSGDVKNVTIKGEAKEKIIDRLAQKLNSATKSNRGAVAFEIADEMLSRLMMKVEMADSDGVVTKSMWRVKDILAPRELISLRQSIIKDILNAFDEKGKPTTLAKTKEKYKQQIALLKKNVRENNEATRKRLAKAAKRAESIADLVNDKKYSKEVARNVIDKMQPELVFGDVIGVIDKKTFDDTVSMLWANLNSASPDKRGLAAFEVANFLIDNTVVVMKDENGNVIESGKELRFSDAIAHDKLSQMELNSFRQKFVKEILDTFDEKGENTKLATVKASYKAKLDHLSKKVREEKRNVISRLDKAAKRAEKFADSVNERVYSKEDAVYVLENMELELVFGETLGIVNGVSRDEAVKALWAEMNSAAPGERAAAAFNVADFVIENTTVVAKDENGKIVEDGHKLYLVDALGARELASTRQRLAIDVLNAFDERGKPSTLANAIKEYTEKADFWKKKASEERDIAYKANRVLEKTKRLGELVDGSSVSSTMSKTMFTRFKRGISLLARIRYRGNLNKRSSRRLLRQFYEWYTDKENKLVHGREGVFNEEIADILKALSQNERTPTDEENKIISSLIDQFKTANLRQIYESYTKDELGEKYDQNVKDLLRELSAESPFSLEELNELEKVVGHFAKLVRDHNKVFWNGRWVSAPELAERYIANFERRKKAKPGMLGHWFEKFWFKGYLATFGDPMSVMRYMDGYNKNGFFTEMLGKMRKAALEAAVLEMKICESTEKFYKKHKNFRRELQKKTVEDWNGEKITLAQGIALYMTLGREQAIKGLAKSGYAIQTSEDTEAKRFNGFAPAEDITDKELAEKAGKARKDLYKQFTEDERAYIKLAEKAFEECKVAKYETDMLRHGYSNVIDSYYFPVFRAYVSRSIDAVNFAEEIDRVSSKPFNNDTVKGASGELFIGDVDAILNRHIRGVSQYAKLAVLIDNFDILYSLDVSEKEAAKVKSIKSESEGVWKDGEKYLRDMLMDVQGVPRESKTPFGSLLSYLRSGYAKSLLAANPKVLATQFTSLAAATSILDADCIIKGFSISAKDVDKYCALAQLRNTDNAAALAQGVLDKVSGVGDVLMKPIGAVDRFVIERLFAACQVQVAKHGGLALGTEENKVGAGKLLEQVIFETQQNSLATERSAAMRSGNEIERTATMFSADAMKIIGHVIDSFGEYVTLKNVLKNVTDPSEKESLGKQLKAAGKKVRRSVGALLSSSLMMAILAQLVRRLLNKKDKEEDVANIVGDTVGNLVGGLPVIRDVTSFIADGYEVDHYAYSALNDLLQSASALWGLGQDALGGDWDSRKTAQAIRKSIYTTSAVVGLPTRNLYNYTYGLVNMVSNEAGYKMDNFFYKQTYRADLAAAIEKGDEGMIATITALMLDENIGGLEDKVLRQTMSDLIAAGFDVLPRSVGDSVTYNKQTYELSAKQRKAFEATYKQAHEAAAKLVKLKGFASASEAVKTKAIGFVYDLYYDMAVHQRVGDGATSKNALFAKAIDVPVLALAVATAKNFESDKDENGKTVAGSLKKKVHDYLAALDLKAAQKYMLMGYLGYKNTLGEDKVKAYIQTLKLSSEEKEKLLRESGY